MTPNVQIKTNLPTLVTVYSPGSLFTYCWQIYWTRTTVPLLRVLPSKKTACLTDLCGTTDIFPMYRLFVMSTTGISSFDDDINPIVSVIFYLETIRHRKHYFTFPSRFGQEGAKPVFERNSLDSRICSFKHNAEVTVQYRPQDLPKS